VSVPPVHIQQQIIDQIAELQNEAIRLRQQARQKLDDAKSEVEKLILGSP